MGGLIVGLILILIGVSALLGISLFHFLFAVILIAIGISLLTGRSPRDVWRWRRHASGIDGPHGAKTVSSDDHIDEVVIFSYLNKAFTGSRFDGGKIVTVFSGAEIDLAGAHAEEGELHIDVSSVFGGTTIIIPKTWKVRSSAAAFFGNVSVPTDEEGEGGTTLVVHGESVFGEIVVRK